ncbi:MAG TPA: helix-hairpin-helix domain-containing protein [Myxococcota bacterium]|nr:helix-hairpin-helix domain-containing protein [Myxococcota bacterium]
MLKRLSVGLGLLLVTSVAQARVYPSPILVDDEDDLEQLYRDGLLTADDYETLLELLHDPIDLNRARRGELVDLPGVSSETAARIIEARRSRGRFDRVEDLLSIEGVDANVVEQIAPFVEVRITSVPPLHGVTRVRTVLALEQAEPAIEDDHPNRSHRLSDLGYERLPSTYLKTTVRYDKDWTVGFAGYAQEDVRDVQFDAERGDVYVGWGTPTFTFAKGFASIERQRVSAIMGSYNVGFGNGLTFDRSSRRNPEGWYRDLELSGTEHYRSARGLFGGAVQMRTPVGEHVLETTLFASSWRYDVYQYDLGLGEGDVVDPESDELTSPRVYVLDREGNYQKTQYVTIPDVYREDLLGADATLRLGHGLHYVGATAWAGHMDRTLLDGAESDYDLVLRGGYPVEDYYGAAGVHGGAMVGLAELRAEVATSFTGGNGYSLQAVVDQGWGEFDVTLRRYDVDFDNPHARGTANADEVQGYRDRDEQGILLKTQLDPAIGWSLRGRLDLWQNISVARWNSEAYGRVTHTRDDWRLAAFADYKNRDLSRNGRGYVYGGEYDAFAEYSGEDLDDIEVTDRAGIRTTWGGEVRNESLRVLTLTAFYKRYYEDTGLLYPTLDGIGPCEYWFQIGQYVWVKAQVKPTPNTGLQWRVKYLDDSVHGSHGERYVESYLQLDQKLPERRVRLSVRGTVGKNLADPEADWADACSRAGLPELEGSCVATDTNDNELAEPGSLYGLVRASVEWRF